MDTSKHDLAAFFDQLGLPNKPQDINTFIATHHLPADMPLAQANFWSRSQAMMIAEALAEDSDWAEVADELAARLSAPTLH